MSKVLKSRRGDTLIEVVLGFAIFSTVAAFTIAIMNSSLTNAEAALELTLARNEIDAQAETLRFVHNSFLNDRNYESSNQPYRNLWIAIRKLATADASRVPRLSDSAQDCGALYNDGTGLGTGSIYNISSSASPSARAFVLNTRKLQTTGDFDTTLITADNSSSSTMLFYNSTLNPRLVYTNGENTTDDTLLGSELDDEVTTTPAYDTVARVEGIWDVAVKENVASDELSRFYDFHVYTCWFPPGAKRPTTIGTIIRLYNPEYIEESYF
ncbi:type II secretion system protein [Candidatus Saccharibacteria bacterium]|nr:type II secretion system protein [Candidatus Saccharibacteria bacterium]